MSYSICRGGEAGVNRLVQQMREMIAGSDIETAEYMIQDIFEEYMFFAQYPPDKLRTTAAFIGTMIAQGVLVGRSLFVALKMIIEGIKVRLMRIIGAQLPRSDHLKAVDTSHAKLYFCLSISRLRTNHYIFRRLTARRTCARLL
jgi:hypothetical protein